MLTAEQVRRLEGELDKCDAALADKPVLASVYDPAWRADFRRRTLSVNNPNQVLYPRAYALPHFDRFYPADLQSRIEEGAAMLLPILSDADRSHTVSRLRWESASAEEECLLVRGVAAEFGRDSIRPPHDAKDKPKPEFSLHLEGCKIDFEAKGLFDSDKVASLTRATIESGGGCWFAAADTRADLNRLRAAVVKKLRRPNAGVPKIVLLTQYTAWPTAPEAVTLLRELAIKPEQFELSPDTHALGIGYVYQFVLQGAWFNNRVGAEFTVPEPLVERLRSAIMRSFYPRCDDIFLTEKDDEERHFQMVERMMNAGCSSDMQAS